MSLKIPEDADGGDFVHHQENYYTSLVSSCLAESEGNHPGENQWPSRLVEAPERLGRPPLGRVALEAFFRECPAELRRLSGCTRPSTEQFGHATSGRNKT